MELLEALYTTRAMRRVKPDPIPEATVARIMDAAVRAPSGSNAQNWRFITVTDPVVKEPLGKLYGEAFEILQTQVYAGAKERAEAAGDEGALRIISSSQWLVDNFEHVPLWIFVFSRNDPSGSSIYPAIWNMMLAARGEGIGTCLTTSWASSRRTSSTISSACRPTRVGSATPLYRRAIRPDGGAWPNETLFTR